MNERTDEFRPGKKVIPRTVPEKATVNEEGLELISLEQVKELTQISTSGIYARAKDREDDFPMSVDIGTSGKGSKKMWLRLEILQFISNRMENRRMGKSDDYIAPSIHASEWDNIGGDTVNE